MELRSSGLLARCHSVRRLQVTTGPVHVQGKEGRNVRYRKVKGGEGRDTSCTIEAFGIKEVATSQGRRTAPENGRCTAWRMLRRNVTDDILPIDSTCASTASVGYDICHLPWFSSPRGHDVGCTTKQWRFFDVMRK